VNLRKRAGRIYYVFSWTLTEFTVLLFWLFSTLSVAPFALGTTAFVHGLWVWKSPTILEAPHAAESLLEFCSSEGINEVHVSVSERSEPAEEEKLVHLIALLHRANIRVEAL
jgi:hypothetical protein